MPCRALVATLLALGLLAGCGDDAEDTRAELATLYQEWAGTPEERSAARFVAVARDVQAFGDCMQAAGVTDFVWQAGIEPGLDIVADGTQDSLWLAEPGQRIFSELAKKSAYLAVIEERGEDPAPIPGRDEAFTECARIHTAPSGPIELVLQPRTLSVLDDAWLEEIDELERDHPSRRVFDDCMVEEGVPGAENEDDPVSGFEAELAALDLDEAEVATESARDESPVWAEFLAIEDDFVEADVACRSGEVAEQLPAALEAAETFADENADDIATMRRHWEAIRVEAEDAGWSADQPFGEATALLLNDPLADPAS